jgi:hypothetical protein
MFAWSLLVATAVANLGNEQFAVRQHASAALAACGRSAQPWVEAAARSDDPEVAHRATVLLQECRRQQAKDYLARRCDPWPWLDMLPDDVFIGGRNRHELFQTWWDESPIVLSVAPEWQRFREATRLFVRFLIEEGHGEEEIGELLGRMQELEREWWRGPGRNWPKEKAP